ncbi:MAG TPA: hypothetical protein VHC21_01365 [Candidatus Saccharimonadales bacterium]|nr:hypothetical protein [Candidatus Saccharimonadales bacterium]
MPEAKRVLLLGGQSDNQADYEAAGIFSRKFSDAADGLGAVQFSQCFYDELALRLDTEFSITDCRNMVRLQAYDLVIFKGAIAHSYVAGAISRYLKNHRVGFLNDYGPYRTLNKLGQLIDLWSAKLSLPPATLYTENHELMAAIVGQEWNFPIILKAVNGSRGRYNYLIRSSDELTSTLKQHPGRNFLAQAYIENDCDYRVLIIGEEVLVLRRYGRSGSHLHNTSQGGRIETLPATRLPAEVVKASKKLAGRLGLEIAGVDVIQDRHTGSYYFLEINSQPAVGQPEARPLLRKLLQQKINLKN